MTTRRTAPRTGRKAGTQRRSGIDARLARIVVAVVVLVVGAAWWNTYGEPGAGPERTSPSPGRSRPALPRAVDAAALLDLLAEVRVVAERPEREGYDRDCGPGEGCVFGPSWTDDTDAPQGHNGCDTRNDVLGDQLRDVRYSPRSPGCDVVAGTLSDPYTGVSMDYETQGSQIHIDHVYPLAAAWDHGAAGWSERRRAAFANDTDLELVATTQSANLGKGDSTPAEWLPALRGARCAYLARYLEIAGAYDLTISAADADTVRLAARSDTACVP